jgi:hypothetical protein
MLFYRWALTTFSVLFQHGSKLSCIKVLHIRQIPISGPRNVIFFYSKLRGIGYGSRFLLAEFAKVTWADRAKILAPKISPADLFDQRCVWSVQNSPGLHELFRASSLNLATLEPRISPAAVSKDTKSATVIRVSLEPNSGQTSFGHMIVITDTADVSQTEILTLSKPAAMRSIGSHAEVRP